MTGKLGISLLDLLDLPSFTNTLISDSLAAQLEAFSIIDHRSTTSDDAFIHYGTVQALSESLELPSLRNWPVQIPGVHNGIPFQLTRQRSDITNTLEPSAEAFNLDLFLDRISIVVPGLKPAQRVASGDLSPRHLVLDPKRDTVRIYGSGVLRLQPDASGNITARLIDAPDPFDPLAPTGAVYTLGFDPPHFFVGDSSVGLTVDQLTYDDSAEYTPEAIVARGQAPLWQGIAIREATVYLPRNCPYVGDLSVGVRDVLLGSPTGLQGEIQIELGYTPISPETIDFQQQIINDGQLEIVSLNLFGSGDRNRTVQLHPSTEATARVRAKFKESAATGLANWYLPGGQELSAVSGTPFFEVSRDRTELRYGGVETAEDGTTAISPEVTVQFEFVDPETAYAPKINLRLEGTTYQNVIHLSGSRDQLEGLAFIAEPLVLDDINTVPERLVWRFGREADQAVLTKFDRAATGYDVRLDTLPEEPGQYTLSVEDACDRKRHVLIELLPTGNLIIGGINGARDRNGPIDLNLINSVYNLHPFHQRGLLQLASGAEVDGARNALGVAAGTIKSFVINRGTPTDPDAEVPVPSESEQRIQQTIGEVRLELDTEKTSPFRWANSPHRPARVTGYTDASLFAWINSFSADTKFYIIGRCDDLWRGENTRANPTADVTNSRAREKNRKLANDRAQAVLALLSGQVASDRLFARGEQDTAWHRALSADDTSALNALSSDLKERIEGSYTTNPTAVCAQGVEPREKWLIRREQSGFCTWDRTPSYQGAVRQTYRRVEIHAIGGAPTENGDDSTSIRPEDPTRQPPARRRILIPGEDLTTLPSFTPREPALPYRVRLTVKWDSPTVIEPADAIPTQAEILVQWDNGPANRPAIPGSGGEPLPAVTSNGREILTFIGTWSYDARSGLTVFSLAIDSKGDPSGLFDPIESNTLALALGFGPALMAALPATDTEGNAAKLAGLVVASAILGETVVQEGKVAIYRIEAEQTLRSLDTLENSRLRVTFDYSAEMGFDTRNLLGEEFPINIYSSKPIKVRYKNVGMEIDDSREGLDKLGLVYEDVSFEIEDPGQWTIDGELGQLLSVTDARSGTGSVWYELDLAFALDLGVITLTGATVRLTFKEGSGGLPDFELRGLAASVNIPGALKGSGSVSLGSGGTFRAGMRASIIPADIKAAGSLAYNSATKFFFIEVGLILSAGIPLGPTGLGIYGFVGRFVTNGQRSFGETPFHDQPGDPIQKEIDWHRLAPENKYAPKSGQWSLGLGAVVGTLPDTAFTFNALGMFTLGLPDPEVIFGIDARFVSKPELPAEQASDGGRSFKLLGIVAIDKTGVKLGIRGEFTIENLLTLKVPISAYYPASGDGYLRIGSDGVTPPDTPQKARLGDPVTLVILPEILDVRAWSYLMVEENGLSHLGGNKDFSFQGFSIGFGAGWDIRWSAGPIKLEASAKVLVGVGTNPLMLVAGIFVRGELSLVVVSIAAAGELVLKLKQDEKRLDGKFCGKVDLFFFSIEGCVGISIGSEPGAAMPPPASPVLKVDLTDRRGVVTGRARFAGRAAAGDNTLPGEETLPERVWPDTVPVIHFAHFHDTVLNGTSDFQGLGPAPAGERWSGTSELKYAYRLVSVRLREVGTGATVGEDLSAVWWLPTYREGVLGKPEVTASEQEGRLLALLSWHPAPWARVLDLAETTAIPPGDPANTIEQLCNPTPKPQRVCVLGNTMVRLDIDRVRLTSQGPSLSPFFNDFAILGRESAGTVDLATAVELYEETGRYLVPGRRQLLLGSTDAKAALYRLPYLALRDRISTTLQFDGQFVPAITEPDLILLACFSDKTEVPLPNQEVCDRYGDLTPDRSFSQLQRNTFTYRANNPQFPIQVVDMMPLQGDPELLIPHTGMTIRFNQFTQQVTLRLAHFNSPVTVEAVNGRGETVATRSTPRTQGTEHRLVISGGIIELRLSGGGGEGVLMGLCLQTKGRGPHIPDDPDQLPMVYGVTAQGEKLRWQPQTPQVIPNQDKKLYALIRYRPESGAYAWQQLQIQPWTRGELFFYTCCGTTQAAADLQQQDQAYRDTLQDHWNKPGQDQDDQESFEHPHLLQANTEYELDITWEWTGWRKTEEQPSPPALTNRTAWQQVREQYRFSTAQHTDADQMKTPVDFVQETIFDPRNSLRYLLGFEPATPEIPHFLKDPLYVDFVVDHLEALLKQYNYELQLRLELTTPPAGALSQPGFELTTPVVLNWRPLLFEYLAGSDQRLIEAADEAPCLEPPPLGGKTAELTANLKPKSGYDLILVAAGSSAATEDVVISRSHFRTSRYSTPTDLVSALGFSQGEPNTILPGDAIVTAPLPTVPILDSDTALEATLRDLGLDPWPLPTYPRTVTLWRFEANTWQLVGILIETDEPIERTGRQIKDTQLTRTQRLSLSHAQVNPPTGAASRFNPVRRNQASTRYLLAPASPITVPVGSTLSLVLQQPNGILTGSRELIRGPRMAYREGLL